jgi:dipeptidyl aminopeptidase/acylaminoacyl peptidase
MKHCLFFLLALSCVTLNAQVLPPGPQVLTIHSDVDDTEQPYGLYLPKNYDASKKYPLVMMLHGAGSNHRLALRRVFGKSNAPGETDVEVSRTFPEFKDVNYIVASPFARGTMGYQGVAEKDVMDVLADVKKRFNIDEDRTYLTGLSMGGGGTLWIGLTRPDIWAAIAPVCPAPPQGTDELSANALNIPAHFFHGDKDQAVPVTVSRDWTKKFKELGNTVSYIEYPEVNHNSWENAYADASIFDWFAKFKRDRFPNQVRFNTKSYAYNKAYWVEFDHVIPGVLAVIDAKFTGPNQIEIKTEHTAGFTFKLDGHPQYDAAKPLQITIDGKKVKTTAGATSFSLNRDSWLNTKFNLLATSKQKGMEGPIKAALAERHVYVYGTAGSPSEQELKARREVAEAGANWAAYRNAFLGRVMVFPRVVADKDLRPSDLADAHLVLFGTKETNLQIEKYSNMLPMELSNSATGYGLVYIFPANGRYVVVNSGLPWWMNTKPGGNPFSSGPVAAAAGLKDFVLFKDSNDNKVSEGYFDNDWRVTANDKAALAKEGVVVK